MRGRRFAIALVLAGYLVLTPSGKGAFSFALAVFDPFYLMFYEWSQGTLSQSNIREPRPRDQSQPPAALNPFLDGISSQSSAVSGTAFVRGGDGAYGELVFSAGPPLTLLSSASGAAKLLAAGQATLANAPAVPAGVGTQSQGTALSQAFGSGTVAYASITGNDAGVSISRTSGGGANVFPIGPDVNTVLFADFNKDGNHLAVIAIRPEMRAVGGVDELHRQTNAVSGAAHAALQDGCYAQRVGYPADVFLFAAKRKSRRTRNDLEP
jgi:hypothetical protein